MKLIPVRRIGNDQKIGKYIDGGLFAGYTKNEQGTDYKVVMSVHEVRVLSKIAGIDRQQTSWKVRILERIEKWAKNAKMRAADGG